MELGFSRRYRAASEPALETMIKRAGTAAVLSTILMGIACARPCRAAPSVTAPASGYVVYFGTKGPDAKGVYACRFEPSETRFGPVSLVAEVESATWLTTHPSGKVLYAVSERGNDGKVDGEVSSFAVEPATGSLKPLNRVSSGGGGPTHLVVDKAGKAIAVANYGGASVTVFRLNPDGSLGERTALARHTGSSVHPVRQASPHPHAVVPSPDERFLFVPDRGTDNVYGYRFDAAKGSLAPNDPPSVRVPPGSGPRHLAFHPGGKFAYLIDEMASRITAFSHDPAKGSLTEIQTISTLPEGFAGENTAAEVVVDRAGTFLYASNRGDDSIVVFSISPANGTLTMVQRVPAQGKRPRSFSIDPSGRFLLVANQDSNSVPVFEVDATTGKLSSLGRSLSVPAPACIVFVPASPK
jgi:6-phosphogluconolactonase